MTAVVEEWQEARGEAELPEHVEELPSSVLTDLAAAPRIDEVPMEKRPGRLAAMCDGYSLECRPNVRPHDRRGLARLFRYGTRPAFAQDRLTLENGRVICALPKPFWTGQTHAGSRIRRRRRRHAELGRLHRRLKRSIRYLVPARRSFVHRPILCHFSWCCDPLTEVQAALTADAFSMGLRISRIGTPTPPLAWTCSQSACPCTRSLGKNTRTIRKRKHIGMCAHEKMAAICTGLHVPSDQGNGLAVVERRQSKRALSELPRCDDHRTFGKVETKLRWRARECPRGLRLIPDDLACGHLICGHLDGPLAAGGWIPGLQLCRRHQAKRMLTARIDRIAPLAARNQTDHKQPIGAGGGSHGLDRTMREWPVTSACTVSNAKL